MRQFQNAWSHLIFIITLEVGVTSHVWLMCTQSLSPVWLFVSPPGSCFHGIFQARILECAAMLSSRDLTSSLERLNLSSISHGNVGHKPQTQAVPPPTPTRVTCHLDPSILFCLGFALCFTCKHLPNFVSWKFTFPNLFLAMTLSEYLVARTLNVDSWVWCNLSWTHPSFLPPPFDLQVLPSPSLLILYSHQTW